MPAVDPVPLEDLIVSDDGTKTAFVFPGVAKGCKDLILRVASDVDVTLPESLAGSGDKNYVHNQVALSASWAVNHGLGKFPAIEVVDSGGSAIIPNVQYIDTNNVTISFAAATSGKAYFN